MQRLDEFAAPAGVRLLRAEKVLEITWAANGPPSRYPVRALRCACRCAGCINEFTGEPILDPRTVPHDVAIEQIRSAGNYALQFEFSDGHGAGLYTWKHLYSLSPQ